MSRFLLSACVLFLSASACLADEYLIRVDAVGYEDADVSEKVPDEAVLRSIEVFAQPNRPFRSQVRLGEETLLLEGVLTPQNNGRFSIELKYRHEVDTGETVPIADGKNEKVKHVSGLSAEPTIKLDEPHSLGGILVSNDKEILPGGEEIQTESKLLHYVIVTRNEASP